MINFGFSYTWLYFASLVFTGWLVTTPRVHGHPTQIYFVKHCTVHCTVYCILHCTLNIAQQAVKVPCCNYLFPDVHYPPSCFLYTIPNTTQCSLLNHIQYTVLYTRFTLYCTLHFTHFTLHCPLHHSLYYSQSYWLI